MFAGPRNDVVEIENKVTAPIVIFRGECQKFCVRDFCEGGFGFACIQTETFMARLASLLGRSERSSPKAAQRRAEGAGLDGDGADQPIVGCAAHVQQYGQRVTYGSTHAMQIRATHRELPPLFATPKTQNVTIDHLCAAVLDPKNRSSISSRTWASHFSARSARS